MAAVPPGTYTLAAEAPTLAAPARHGAGYRSARLVQLLWLFTCFVPVFAWGAARGFEGTLVQSDYAEGPSRRRRRLRDVRERHVYGTISLARSL